MTRLVQHIVIVGLMSVCTLTVPACAQTNEASRTVVLKIKKIIGRLDQALPQSSQIILRIDTERHVLQLAPDCRLGDEEDELSAVTELRKNELVYAVCTDEPGGLIAHRVARVHPKRAKAKPPASQPAKPPRDKP